MGKELAIDVVYTQKLRFLELPCLDLRKSQQKFWPFTLLVQKRQT